ncbi:radical SAM/SPASM domain-containing protein [Streptomyces celluloflavus]|uniref:radical SAM/SPASM domain-containing protein n=1 Tax=Streptomyces celluloflavus TaxID=58344 RepID=UPI0036890862
MALLAAPQFVWLEITGFCNLNCRHCYADSSPQGDHGTMTPEDWFRSIDDLAVLGARHCQFIGGEPTLHPDFPGLVRHARARNMQVEVFSNLTHLTDEAWAALRLTGVSLAFSYYSDDPGDHDDVTANRGAHRRTRANVEKAREYGIPLRGAVINVLKGQRGREGRRDLLDVGIRDVRTDKIRPFGRGANGAAPDIRKLCGRCGRNKMAISPNGDVWPCVFARWMPVGNVREQSIREIYHGVAMQGARAELAHVFPEKAQAGGDPSCLPDCGPSFETCAPQLACAPDAVCGPTGESTGSGKAGESARRLTPPIMSPHRSVRYRRPGVAGTDC